MFNDLILFFSQVEKYKTGGGFYTPKVTEAGAKLLSLLAPQFNPLKSPYDSSATYYGNGNYI